MHKKYGRIFLSIVTPVFNENKRIKNLKKILIYLEDQAYPSELVIVDDGSTDDTLKKIIQILSGFPKLKKVRTQVVSYRKNKGKGYAVKKGMLKASGLYRLFMDIDLSTPLNSFSKFENYIDKYPVVIGSRKVRGANISKRQPLLREYLGKTFTKLSQLVLNVRVSDFTCGYKCFSEHSAKEIFKRQKIKRWGFDSEILFLATRLGFDIKEVPVNWINNPNSKVKFPRDLFRSFSELVEIKVNYITNQYGLK